MDSKLLFASFDRSTGVNEVRVAGGVGEGAGHIRLSDNLSRQVARTDCQNCAK